MKNALISDEMEKVAIPIWDERVSPVLDTATCLILFDLNDGKEQKREVLNIPQEHFVSRANYIAGLKIDTILCGALSRPMHQLLHQRGIAVVSWVSGVVDEVIRAYIDGSLAGEQFALPGRRCRRRQRGFGNKRYNRNQGSKNSHYNREEL
jgi:predicted Fe-Mo cluster-binding NifX family protein